MHTCIPECVCVPLPCFQAANGKAPDPRSAPFTLPMEACTSLISALAMQLQVGTISGDLRLHLFGRCQEVELIPGRTSCSKAHHVHSCSVTILDPVLCLIYLSNQARHHVLCDMHVSVIVAVSACSAPPATRMPPLSLSCPAVLCARRRCWCGCVPCMG